ncbi:hypothetical protein E2C01_095823 [Portunus trituberculatus]|uniref:Uncharacterized protein n=1 Tax=Portunus trituberculatus TaxID=210409 RepID=A0A5B7K1E4_PORTR|nr:hypothetical protein [Portunus trituberculatus]
MTRGTQEVVMWWPVSPAHLDHQATEKSRERERSHEETMTGTRVGEAVTVTEARVGEAVTVTEARVGEAEARFGYERWLSRVNKRVELASLRQ